MLVLLIMHKTFTYEILITLMGVQKSFANAQKVNIWHDI